MPKSKKSRRPNVLLIVIYILAIVSLVIDGVLVYQTKRRLDKIPCVPVFIRPGTFDGHPGKTALQSHHDAGNKLHVA